MPYTISWYIEHRVILIEVSGPVSLDEFERLHSESFEYVAASSHKVHAIADISTFTAVPNNLKMLMSSAHKDKNDRQGMTVLVAPTMPRILYFLVSVLLQSLRLEYRMADTVDEAMEILRRIDAEIMGLATPG